MANEKLIKPYTMKLELSFIGCEPKHLAAVERCATVEVVHGRWEWYEALVNPYALCSNCGCGLDKRDALNFAYCPYCGAKMDGDGNGTA